MLIFIGVKAAFQSTEAHFSTETTVLHVEKPAFFQNNNNNKIFFF